MSNLTGSDIRKLTEITKSAAQIDSAVDSAHSVNSDTKLDEGGDNEVSAANAKAAYTHSGVTTGNPHSVTKSEVGLGDVDNKSEATIISDVKADSDVADAISKKHSNSLDHTQNTDQGLDTGGANEVSVVDVKDAVTKRNKQQVITVAKAGGDYDNIQEARDSILGEASDNIFTILVYPGSYNGFKLLSYVNMVAVDPEATMIISEVSDNNHECHCYLK